MPLQHAILAALAHDEASGYDLSKSFDVSVANYWAATAQQLYRELGKLEDAGLIRARVVEQEKRPNKRVFSLTSAGRAALHEFTTHAPKPTAIRDELLVQIEALEVGDPAAIQANIAGHLTASQAKLARYQKRRDHLLAGQTEAEYIATGERLGRYFLITRGIIFEQENIRWGESVLDALSARRAGG